VPDEVREDLTIHTVDMIDEVLHFALEPEKSDELLDTPQLWNADAPTSDISTVVE
jgi:predicted ATP-dependent protease